MARFKGATKLHHTKQRGKTNAESATSRRTRTPAGGSRAGRRSRRIWIGGCAKLPTRANTAPPALRPWNVLPLKLERSARFPAGRRWAIVGPDPQGPGRLCDRSGYEQLLGALAPDRRERPGRGFGWPCDHPSCGQMVSDHALCPGQWYNPEKASASLLLKTVRRTSSFMPPRRPAQD